TPGARVNPGIRHTRGDVVHDNRIAEPVRLNGKLVDIGQREAVKVIADLELIAGQRVGHRGRSAKESKGVGAGASVIGETDIRQERVAIADVDGHRVVAV